MNVRCLKKYLMSNLKCYEKYRENYMRFMAYWYRIPQISNLFDDRIFEGEYYY